MKCSNVRERLSSYVDGVLDEYNLELIESHVSECADCQRELDALRMLVATASHIDEIRPPVNLKHRIMAAVREAREEEKRCAQAAEMLSAYVDGELPARQEGIVAEHLANCEPCAAELRALSGLVQAAGAIDLVTPPADLRERIMAAAAKESAPRFALGYWLRDLSAGRAAQWAGAGIAAVVIVAGVLVGTPNETRQAGRATMKHEQPVPVAKGNSPATGTVPAVVETPREVVESSGQAAQEARSARVIGNAKQHRARTTSGRVSGTTSAKPPAAKPVAKAHPRPVSHADGTTDDGSHAETNTAAPVEVAVATSASEPTPEVKYGGNEGPAPLIKVAAAPNLSFEPDEEWMERMKARAAMRNADRPTGALRIISTRF